MTQAASISTLGTDFDDFLFAPIVEEKTGMLLSVLSALARLGLDPRQEAAKLALLSGESAVQRLAILIATLPDWPARLDTRTVAARLIALLPRQTASGIVPGKKESAGGTAARFRHFIYLICIVVVLSIQYMMMSHQQAPADNSGAVASSTVLPHSTAPNSDE